MVIINHNGDYVDRHPQSNACCVGVGVVWLDVSRDSPEREQSVRGDWNER